MSIKQTAIDHIKNIYGWKTKRKLVVFSVDDYGNVRIDSKAALSNLEKAGCELSTRFDHFDALENTEDLYSLYEVLCSVRDEKGRNAVFTPFALPCNIDFEIMEQEGYQQFHNELLPETYRKLEQLQPSSYAGAWELWKEGIAKGIMVPQFHGREHLHLKVFNEKLEAKDPTLMASLKNRSFTGISDSGYSTIGYTAAYEFWDLQENETFKGILSDGLQAFEKVYGYPAVHFNPPGGREHPSIHAVLKKNGIKYLDTPWVKKEHLGNGRFKRVINYTGKRNAENMVYEVRNVVFEPGVDGMDWVAYALKQIEMAFMWNRPAIISSHRVNFCGQIDPNYRKKGLEALKSLLAKIMVKWPDVEFISANELGDIITT